MSVALAVRLQLLSFPLSPTATLLWRHTFVSTLSTGLSGLALNDVASADFEFGLTVTAACVAALYLLGFAFVGRSTCLPQGLIQVHVYPTLSRPR